MDAVLMLKHAPAAVIIAALVIVLMWLQGRHDDAQVKWNASVEAAQLEARKEVARADSLIAASQTYRQQADSVQAVADSMAALRPRLIVRIDSVPVPAEAVPFTAPRDTLIAVLTAENNALRSVADRLRVSNKDLLIANALLKETVESFNKVLDARPKPRSRLWPVVTVGACAGVGVDMRPFAGPCAAVGWKL
jgi:hypothetical protein